MLRTVALRAAHQLLDNHPIFVDAVAPRLVSENSLREVALIMGEDHVALRTVVALRSRFAEDRLAEAAAMRHVSQYVMVGAGFDTFPWRQPDYAQNIRLFAADHPNSIAATSACLREHGLHEPANLRTVAVDLEDGCLGDSLVHSGFNPRVPAFFSALGVTQYLTRAAIQSLLEFIVGLPTGSEIVMSFVPAAEDLSEQDVLFVSRALRRVAAVGEPWSTRLSASEFVKELRSLGFSQLFHLTPQEAYTRYFASRRDGRSAPGFEQMICAVV